MTKYLRTEKVAEILDINKKTLEAWRIRGEGPPYIYISNRCVRYPSDELFEWINKHRQTSTSSINHAN